MQISIERIIKEGDISPLKWGMSGEYIAHKLPHSHQLIQKRRQGNYPFLDFDGVELYFEEDFYLGLNQLIIQAWRIKAKASTQWFEPAWIHQKLTYDKAKRHLMRLGWAYKDWSNPTREMPSLLVEGRALFLFYEAEDDGEHLLCKVVILNPEDARNIIERLN